MISSPPVCADGNDTTSVATIASSFSESWCGRKNCPLPYISIACSPARSVLAGGSPRSSRTSPSTTPSVACQAGPPSVTRSGVISHVSRTLVSVSICSARPNVAGLPTAISFFASGPRTGTCTAPGPATPTRSASAGARICALKDPAASASSSRLASRSRAVRPMNTPPARTLNGSDRTAGHRPPLPGRGMVFAPAECLHRWW